MPRFGANIGIRSTDDDGRCSSLIPPETILEEGVYKVVFETQPYFESTDRSCFYPFVEVFMIALFQRLIVELKKYY